MWDRDSWYEIWVALSRNKVRTALTAFGVFWGIFMLVLLLGSGTGLQRGVTEGFSNHATNSFFLWGQSTTEPYRGLPVGRDIQMTNDDTTAIRREVPDAAVVAPRIRLGGWNDTNNVVRGDKAGAFDVMGDHPIIRQIQSLDITAGRFLNQLDLDENRKVAVIGRRVREVLFGPEEAAVGGSVRIAGVEFKVVGIFDIAARGDRGERELETIYVPFTTFQKAFNYGNEVDWYAITADPGITVAAVEEQVLTLLKERHDVAPDDERAFGHFNLAEEFQKVQNLFLGIKLLVWIVGTGTLAAGVIGVSNIMLIIVRERTKEIGMRRAVGATPWKITSQILLESVVLTGLAGYVGLLTGVGVLELARMAVEQARANGGELMFANPGIDFQNALFALSILVLSGLAAGLLPARRATAISPTVALRTE